MDFVNVDRTINNIENTLTDVSAYPVVGTLAGCTKVLMGAVQELTGIACGILTFIPAAITGDWSSVKYSWTHIKHGVGNMGAGIVEAIPLVQTVLYGVRQIRQVGNGRSDTQVCLYTGHEYKFMPYASLVERDWGITGLDNDRVKRVKEIFNRKLQENGGAQNIPVKRQMELAEEAIKE